MSAPQAVPRRRRPSILARVQPFWVLALATIALCAWGAAAFSHASWFRLARVSVNLPLDAPVRADEVRRAAAIPADVNVWLLRPGPIARRVEAIPYVERASVRRGQFPQPFVEIGVTVRRPASCVLAGPRAVTIDAARRVLQNGCAQSGLTRIRSASAALPPPGGTISNPEIERLLADARVLDDASLGLRALWRDRWGGLEAVDVTGVALRFGEDGDLAKKAALVQAVREGAGLKRPLRTIDLRVPRTPVVEYK